MIKFESYNVTDAQLKSAQTFRDSIKLPIGSELLVSRPDKNGDSEYTYNPADCDTFGE